RAAPERRAVDLHGDLMRMAVASEGRERPESSVCAMGTRPITTVIEAPEARQSMVSVAPAMYQD
ncbi:MAG: hypothetical protein EBX37_05285, partial [Alphaproteobacteria bacterium]|nr:hypothetical protein [Alphaproteobacteria bacterium]